MIIFFSDFGKHFSQKNYDKFFEDTQLSQVPCPTCGHKGCLVKFGSYKRSVKSCGEEIRMRIQRVSCKECSDKDHVHTHALMLSDIVPYSQVPLSDQVKIIRASGNREKTAFILEHNPLLDFNYVYWLLKLFAATWKERIISERISLSDIPGLCRSCFSHFSRQFMQNKIIPTSLFDSST